MTDKKFEELLKEAVEQCAEKEWEEISQKSKKIRYKPSKEFDNCFDYVLKSKLKEPNMSLDKEIELAKEYFANIS